MFITFLEVTLTSKVTLTYIRTYVSIHTSFACEAGLAGSLVHVARGYGIRNIVVISGKRVK